MFISPILFGGEPALKLKAAHQAGFSGVEFWHDDLAKVDGGVSGAHRLLTENELTITDLQLLADFDGAPEAKRQKKRREALDLLSAAVEMGAPVLAVTASTDPACDRDRVQDDLAWLVGEAKRRGVRVSYEPLSWSVANATLPDAWSVVRGLDREVIGLVVDSYHIFSKGRTAEDLANIPADRIFAVQFADACTPIAAENYKDVARTHRLLPGDGDFPLHSLVEKLAGMGYDGPVGIEVFNIELAKQDPVRVAKRAMASLTALWSNGQPNTAR